jgi:hypothetical protein
MCRDTPQDDPTSGTPLGKFHVLMVVPEWDLPGINLPPPEDKRYVQARVLDSIRLRRKDNEKHLELAICPRFIHIPPAQLTVGGYAKYPYLIWLSA